MNKKGDVFLTTFAILMLIVVVFGFGIIISNESKIKKEFDLGGNQVELINTFYKAEGDLFNLNQEVKYSSFKVIKEFSDNGGVIESCNQRWKFNSECEPDLENYFLETFNEKMKEYSLEIKNVEIINGFLVGDVGEFEYGGKNERINYSYKVEGNFNESLKIDIKGLEDLKDKIEDCVTNGEELSNCAGGSKDGDIIEFSIDIGRIFYGSKFEDIVFVFDINAKDTGITTSVFTV